jgi:hypothetical protein
MEILATAIALLFAFISLFIAYHSIKYMIDCHRMISAGLCANGTVTALKQEERSRKGRKYTVEIAVVSFETTWKEKREIEYAPNLSKNKLKVGDQLKVWYDEKDREIFTLGGWYMVKEIAYLLFIVLCFGLPSWTLIGSTLIRYFSK